MMLRLCAEDLHRASVRDLERLAAFLGCVPAKLPDAEGPRRRALVHAVMAAEKRLARGPRSKLWEL